MVFCLVVRPLKKNTFFLCVSSLSRDKTLSEQTFIRPSDYSTKPSRDKTSCDQKFICPSDHSTKDMVEETSSDLFYPADHSPSRSLIDSPTLYKQEIRKGLRL